jgi:hypothetical protein
MKYPYMLLLSSGVFLLSSCTMFYGKQPVASPVVQSPKPLSVPVGKNWQVIEEAPKLSSEQGRLPFQTEQSVQPAGTQGGTPVDNRKIETSR